MIALDPPFRLAEPRDAPVLAELVNAAGEGLASHVWSRIAAARGETPTPAAVWAIGRERTAARAEAGEIVVADSDGRVVAGLTGYPIAKDPGPTPDDVEPLFRPLEDLERLAPGSWYVNVLATIPEARGQGWGTRLLDLAERLAADQGLARLSLITADGNVGAIRLYRRAGYREAARRAVVRGDWDTEAAEWILMIKDPAAA